MRHLLPGSPGGRAFRERGWVGGRAFPCGAVGIEPPRRGVLERGRRAWGRGLTCGRGHRKDWGGAREGGGGAGPGAGVRGSQQSLVPWLVPLPRHGSALLALVALVVLDSDLAAFFQEHPE